MSTRGTVIIKSEEDRRQITTWARNVEEGTVVTFRKKSRSTEQSAKMWAMLHEVANQVDWYGQKVSAEDWKDMFTASLRHARVVPGIDKGTFVPLGMHTSTMTIEEMTNLIELIYAFGADPDHLVIFKDPKQPNSGESPPSPDTADGIPSSASAGSVSPGAASQPIDGETRGQLIAFTSAVVDVLKTEVLSGYPKRNRIKEIERDWKVMLDDSEHAQLAKIKDLAMFVVSEKRTLTQFINFMASDILGCSAGELGGDSA